MLTAFGQTLATWRGFKLYINMFHSNHNNESRYVALLKGIAYVFSVIPLYEAFDVLASGSPAHGAYASLSL